MSITAYVLLNLCHHFKSASIFLQCLYFFLCFVHGDCILSHLLQFELPTHMRTQYYITLNMRDVLHMQMLLIDRFLSNAIIKCYIMRIFIIKSLKHGSLHLLLTTVYCVYDRIFYFW